MLNNVECRTLVTANRFGTSDYLGMPRTLAPELSHGAPGALRSKRLLHVTTVIHMDATDKPGFRPLNDVLEAGGVDTTRRRGEYSVRIKYDRHAERYDADSQQDR